MLKAWMVLAAIAVASAAGAQQAPGAGLSIQLGSAQTLTEPQACRITFTVENGTGTDLAQVNYTTGIVDQTNLPEMITLSFGAIDDGSLRLRRFDLAGTPCDAIAQIVLQDPTCIDANGADVSTTVCRPMLTVGQHPNVSITLRD